MKKNLSKLRLKIRAVRKFDARGGKGYFSNKNKGVADRQGDALADLRAQSARRWKKMEQEAMANILRGQRELERVAA